MKQIKLYINIFLQFSPEIPFFIFEIQISPPPLTYTNLEIISQMVPDKLTNARGTNLKKNSPYLQKYREYNERISYNRLISRYPGHELFKISDIRVRT